MPDIPELGPVDALGRLVHEDDAAAQLALAVCRLEASLDEAGLSPADLASLTVRTTDRRVLDGVYDVLTERLDALGVDPDVHVVDTDRLEPPGTLVALKPTLIHHRTPHRTHGGSTS